LLEVLPEARRNPVLIALVALFIALHGLVHLLYVAHSQRLIELQPGLAWPDGSWAFSSSLGDETTRLLASIAYLLAAIAFVVSGAALILRQAWWRPLVVGAAVSSSVVIALFWDGKLQQLDNQGLLGLLIDVAILGALFLVGWPPAGL
jgi:hypothetical protein